MKILLSISLLGMLFFGTIFDLEKVRQDYVASSKDATQAEDFVNSLSTVGMKDKVELIGYKGASLALKARYSQVKDEKKKCFQEGAKLIEQAVLNSPKNIELRFIRMSIQENTPKILGYRSDIPADKALILAHFKEVKDISLKRTLTGFILQSPQFTEAEKQPHRD